MIVKYSSLNRLEKPKFTLCNPGSVYNNGLLTKTVGMLVDTEAEELIFNFNATSELNIRINRIMRESPEENEHVYSIYKAVQNRRLIFIDDIGYFMVTNIEDGFDGHNHYKDITAKSIDSEISMKMIPFIENGTYRFSTDSTGENKGILETIVETLPLWTISHVDSVVADKWRAFEDIDTSLNCLSFMLQNMQDAYECIFVFDNITRSISVYDQANYVRQTNIHITKEDLINSLDIIENADDLFTAISVHGDDNVTIAAINPLGTNVIYDFTYYLSWMSDNLSSKVVAWQNAIEEERDLYYRLNLQYFNKLTEVSNLEMDLERLDTQITMYNRCRNNIVAEHSTVFVGDYNDAIIEAGGTQITISDSVEDTLAEIDRLVAECEQSRENTRMMLNTTQSELGAFESQSDATHGRLSMKSYFTQDELSELSHYIFEGRYTDDYVVITDTMSYDDKFAQMKTLYDRAVSQLHKASQPTQEFSVDVENFIFIKEFEEWSEQLETGCLINVELDVNDIAALFLSNMTINYDDHSLKMTFGNRFNKFDPKSLYDDVLGKITKSANTLSFIKDILYPVKNGEFNYMKEAIQTSRNLTMGQALASTGEEVVIDGSGYTGRKLLDSGDFDPRQVKITSNSIVFTDDAWESCKTALGRIGLSDGSVTYGVNAQTIIGDMIVGGQLKIYDSEGNEMFSVIDNKIQLRVGESIGSISEDVSEIDRRVAQLEITEDRFSVTVSNIQSSAVYATMEEFYLSTSPEYLSGGYWSVAQPSWTDGKYLWRRTRLTKGDGTISYTPSEDGVCITGNTGPSGSNGADAVTCRVDSSNGIALKEGDSTILTARIFIGTEEIDPDGEMDYTWYRSVDGSQYQAFATGKTITVRESSFTNHADIYFTTEGGAETFDDLTSVNGVMTIYALANEPTQNGSILTIT